MFRKTVKFKARYWINISSSNFSSISLFVLVLCGGGL